jgi:hypothetical protein
VWTALAVPEQAAGFQGPSVEAFLTNGHIVDVRPMGEGVTRPLRVTLELDGLNGFGVFKSVDIRKSGVTILPDGTSDIDFQDSWETEIGAYVVDRIIGLGMVPATVQRRIEGSVGSIMFGLDVMMDELERVEKQLVSPDPAGWNDQVQKQRLFDQLISNVDRHQGNILITHDFEIRLIDHSRSFRTNRSLTKPELLQRFSRSLLEGLKRLEKNDLEKRVDGHLSSAQIERLLQRRDAILELVQERIAERGEDAVFYK